MKAMLIAGVVLVVLGLFILIRGLNYDSRRSVVRVGGIEASVEERRAVPMWVGGVVLLSGLILAGVGLRGKNAAR
jgi:hypothetical protein